MKWRGKTIVIGDGITAVSGMSGNLPTLSIRKNEKEIKFYRGSSLFFNKPKLSEEDKKFLESLVKN